MARQSCPHQHKGYWRVRVGGQEHHLGKDRRKAFQRFHRLMANRLNIDTTDRPATILGAIDGWLELNPSEWHEWRLKDFAVYAGRMYLDDIETDLLTRYAVHLRQKRHLAPKTVIDRVRTGAAVLRWAHKNRWLATLPETPKMKKPVRKARDLDDRTLRDAFDKLPERAGRVLRFLLATGCRPKEACCLRWKNVHLARGVCILDQHKTASVTGELRTIYLTPEATEILHELHDDDADGFVFTSSTGEPYTTAGLRSIARRRGFTPYQLRHTFAQNASESVPRDVLSKLMGHADESTTRHYYEVRDSRAATAAQSLLSPLRLVKRGKTAQKGENGARVA